MFLKNLKITLDKIKYKVLNLRQEFYFYQHISLIKEEYFYHDDTGPYFGTVFYLSDYN